MVAIATLSLLFGACKSDEDKCKDGDMTACQKVLEKATKALSDLSAAADKVGKAKTSRPLVLDDQLLFKISNERLKESDLSGYSMDNLRILRNAIFARHGYKFKSADLQEYFAGFDWYRSRFADVTAQLSSVEKKNIELIKALESDTGDGFVDSRDGKKYKAVTIGSQTWMAENLNYKMKGSWCYREKPENCNKYGRLYNLSASRQACPAGWHLPRIKEWQDLWDYVHKNKGKLDYDAALMSKTGWPTGNSLGLPKGMDIFGFRALPAGYGHPGFWEGLNGTTLFRAYESGESHLIGYGDFGEDDFKVDDDEGLSIRCVKN